MTGTTREARSDTVRARVADEATKVAVPVIMPSADEAEHPPPLRQILLPVDGTPNSEVMVDWALSEFCRKGDQINLLHVIPKRYAPSSTMYGFEEYVIDVPDPEQEAAWRADAERYLARKVFPKIERAGFRYTSEVVAYETDTTSVGEIVCERAADSDAVAVVMAAQGKGRVREFFVGSVTNYCLHRCAKPVVVFRAPAKAAEQRRGARDGEEAKELPDAEASRDEAKEDLGLKSGEKRADDAPKSAALFF